MSFPSMTPSQGKMIDATCGFAEKYDRLISTCERSV